MRLSALAIYILLLANLVVVLYLVLQRSKAASPAEPSAVISQADKLFSAMKDYSAELQSVAGQANYTDDGEKKSGKDAVRRNLVALEMARMALGRLDERRDRDSLLSFVIMTQYMIPSPPSFSHFTEGKFEDGQYIPGKNEPYANTSRLESMHDDFIVLLTAMLKDAS